MLLLLVRTLLFLPLLLIGVSSCKDKQDSFAYAIKSYEADQAQSNGNLVESPNQDRWESPLYVMVSRNKRLSNEEIRDVCQSPARIALVPLKEGQTLAPETDFKIYREGRSCYERSFTNACVGWIYHGTYACFHFINKNPANP